MWSILVDIYTKLKELPSKTKDFADEYTKAFLSIFGGFVTIIFSALFQMHSLWQLDMICVKPVWDGVLCYSYYPFNDGPLFTPMFGGTVGGAYDFFLGMNYIGWASAIVGTFLVMLGVVLFYRANYLDMKNGVPKVAIE